MRCPLFKPEFFTKIVFNSGFAVEAIYNQTPVYIKTVDKSSPDYAQAVRDFRNSSQFAVYQKQLLILYRRIKELLQDSVEQQSEQSQEQALSNGVTALQNLVMQMHNMKSRPIEDYAFAIECKAALERFYLALSNANGPKNRQIALDLLNTFELEEGVTEAVTRLETATVDMLPLSGLSLLCHVKNKLAESVASDIVQDNGLTSNYSDMDYVNALMNSVMDEYALTPRMTLLGPADISASACHQLSKRLDEALSSCDFIDDVASEIKRIVDNQQQSSVNAASHCVSILDTIGYDMVPKPLDYTSELMKQNHNDANSYQWRGGVLNLHLVRRLVGGGYMRYEAKPLGNGYGIVVVGQDISLSFIVEPSGYCRGLVSRLPEDQKQFHELASMVTDMSAISRVGRDEGKNALHVAAENGRSNLIHRISELDNFPIDETDEINGFTALHFACAYGHFDAACALLNGGVFTHVLVDQGEYEGFDALQIACDRGHYSIVKYILDHGYVENLNYELDENYDNDDWMSPLHLAVYNGHEQIVDLLLNHQEHNVIETVPSGEYVGYDALHLAAEQGHLGIVTKLCQHLAEPKINAPTDREDGFRMTPVQIAIQTENFEIARQLMKHGANLDQPLPALEEHGGKRLIHFAVDYGYHKVLAKLVELGADVNALSYNQNPNKRFKPYQFINFTPEMQPDAFKRQQKCLLALLRSHSLDPKSIDYILSQYFDDICLMHNNDREYYTLQPELISQMLYNGLDIARLETINNIEFSLDDVQESAKPILLKWVYEQLQAKNYDHARVLLINNNAWLGFYIKGQPLLHYLAQTYEHEPGQQLLDLIRALREHPNVNRWLVDHRKRYDYQTLRQGDAPWLWPDWQQRLLQRLHTSYDGKRRLLELLACEQVTADTKLSVVSVEGTQGKLSVTRSFEVARELLTSIDQKLQARSHSIHPRLQLSLTALKSCFEASKSDLILMPKSFDDCVDKLQTLFVDLQRIDRYLAGENTLSKDTEDRIEISNDCFDRHATIERTNKRSYQQLAIHSFFDKAEDEDHAKQPKHHHPKGPEQ